MNDLMQSVESLDMYQLAELANTIENRLKGLRREQREVDEMLVRRESGTRFKISSVDETLLREVIARIGFNKALFEEAKELVSTNAYTAAQICNMSNKDLRNTLGI